MKEKLSFRFDEEGDILDISIGRPKKAISKELEDDILVRVSPKSKNVVGFTIFNFTKRFREAKKAEEIETPINAIMSLS